MTDLRPADDVAAEICRALVAWTRSPTRTAKRVRLGDVAGPDGKRFQVVVEEVRGK